MLLDLYNKIILGRITGLEDIVAQLENQIVKRDQRITELEDEIESFRTEVYGRAEDSKVNLKHELSVIRREIKDFLQNHLDKIQKLEAEEKQIGNRINSLQDQHTNVSQKAKYIENQFNFFKESSETSVKKQMSEFEISFNND